MVDMPNLVYYLNRTSIFEWCVSDQLRPSTLCSFHEHILSYLASYNLSLVRYVGF